MTGKVGNCYALQVFPSKFFRLNNYFIVKIAHGSQFFKMLLLLDQYFYFIHYFFTNDSIYEAIVTSENSCVQSLPPEALDIFLCNHIFYSKFPPQLEKGISHFSKQFIKYSTCQVAY